MIIFIKIAVMATVIAVATTGIIVGVIVVVVPTTTQNACPTLRAPTDLRIVPVENYLTIAWINSTDNCADHFEVVVEINGVVSNITTQVPFYFFEHTANCTEVDISVASIAEDGRRSAPTSQSYVRRVSAGFGTVDDLTITPTDGNEVLVKWVEPTGFDKCTITYQVTIGDGIPIPVEELQHPVSLEGLNYCEKATISVVPVIDSVVGEAASIDTEEVQVSKGFAKVIDLDIAPKTDNNVLVTWVEPKGFEKCTIKYMVTVGADGMPIEVDGLQEMVSLDDVKYCEKARIFVVPVINSITGEADWKDTEEVQVLEGFAKVIDLDITPLTDNNVLVTWGKPVDYETCSVTYKIRVGVDGTAKEVEGLEETVSLEGAKYCDSIYVVPVINTILGEEDSKNTEVDVSDRFATVSNLEIAPQPDNKVLVTWGEPLGYELCTFTYKVTGGVDSLPEDVEGLEKLVSLDGMRYCDFIYVVPAINDVVGGRASVSTEIHPVTIGPVTNLATSIEGTTFTATWGVPVGVEFCRLTYNVELKQGPVTLLTDFTGLQTAWKGDVIFLSCLGSLEFIVVATYDSTDGSKTIQMTPCP